MMELLQRVGEDPARQARHGARARRELVANRCQQRLALGAAIGAVRGIAAQEADLRHLVLWMAGWINSRQLEVIDFLREGNRVL